MERQARLMRRSLIWAILVAVVLLAYRVFNPYGDTPLFIRLAMLVAASVLAGGLIPGSYIHRAIDILLDRPSLGSPTLISVAAVAAPLLAVAVSAFAFYDRFYMLSLIEELNLSFLDPQEVTYNTAWFTAIGVLSLIVLLFNLLDISRLRGSARTT